MQQQHFHAMGCTMLAVLDASSPSAAAAVAATPGWFAAWEQVLSRFRDDSELAALNRRAGHGWTPLSPTLWAVLAAAREAARLSDGLVSPTVLTALEQVGYDRDFAAIGDGQTRPVAMPAPATPWSAIRCDPRRCAVALPAGVRLDLGGVAKGWAADTAVQRLAVHGPALVDAGGDIAVSGPRADGTPWPIGVADPLRPGEQIALLLLATGGVATSGRDYRRWRQGSAERHHIIDPRTGLPATTDLLSATVVAPSAREAEAAAKTVLILGRDAGLAWLAERPHLAGLLVSEEGRIHCTANNSFELYIRED